MQMFPAHDVAAVQGAPTASAPTGGVTPVSPAVSPPSVLPLEGSPPSVVAPPSVPLPLGAEGEHAARARITMEMQITRIWASRNSWNLFSSLRDI